ncbi:MAG: hypothetical protein AAGA03_06200 [Planctomycetota bacterium]
MRCAHLAKAGVVIGEYKVNRSSRRCSVADRPLRSGEWYYSVVVEAGDAFQRTDIAAENWTSPPSGAIGWWKKQMPSDKDRKLVAASPEVLVDLLRQMANDPDQAKTRYLLALMMMRRRILRPSSARQDNPLGAPQAAEPSSTATAQHPEDTESDVAETMTLDVVSDGTTLDIQVCAISSRETEALQDHLQELMFCEADAELDDDDTQDDESSQDDGS